MKISSLQYYQTMNIFLQNLVNCEINNNIHYHNHIYCKIDHKHHEICYVHGKRSTEKIAPLSNMLFCHYQVQSNQFRLDMNLLCFLHYLFYLHILQVDIDKLMLI